MWSDLAVLGQCQNIPIFWHILVIYSEQGTRIELIPFAMSQASRDTSLDYPQHIITKSLKIHLFKDRLPPPLGGPLKIFFEERKTYFPIFLYILVNTLDTC